MTSTSPFLSVESLALAAASAQCSSESDAWRRPVRRTSRTIAEENDGELEEEEEGELSAEGKGRDEDLADGASSELSSVPSMGRQMTELTDTGCFDIMERQCSNFQNRGSEFWVRQNTAPSRRQNDDCVEALRRQISCPQTPTAAFASMDNHLANIQELSSRTPTLDELQHMQMESRQVSAVSQSAGDSIDLGLLETAICSVVTECGFSVSVADPLSLDSDLIAVSEGFVSMTGYSRDEVIGENCRFLSEGCPSSPDLRARLKAAADTGSPFVGVLMNRKRDGTPFLNLLDVRGLIIAQNLKTCEDLWVSIAVQMDVTDMDPAWLPENHMALLKQVGNRIGKRVLKNLGELGLGSWLGQFRLNRGSKQVGGRASGPSSQALKDCWQLMTEARWKPGRAKPGAARLSMEDLPNIATLQLPDLVGLSRRFKHSGEGLNDLARAPVSGGAASASVISAVLPGRSSSATPSDSSVSSVPRGALPPLPKLSAPPPAPKPPLPAAPPQEAPTQVTNSMSAPTPTPTPTGAFDAARWLVLAAACAFGAVVILRTRSTTRSR
mmetsp:Transcript_47264/g.119727  ORF Transcript_47264/g.119727 Transcript_47264/m.119727 type:complete len:554 (-) Transcript_47264:74-1735(-)